MNPGTNTIIPAHDQVYFFSTVCPRNSDPLYIVSYFIKWVSASWTYSIFVNVSIYVMQFSKKEIYIYIYIS